MNYTVEQVGRLLSKLGISFTASSAQRLVENGKVKRVSRPTNCFNTAYNYVVDLDSLQEYLTNEVGLDSNEVHNAIFGGQ